MKLKGYQRYFLSVFLIVLSVSVILGAFNIYQVYKYTFVTESSIYESFAKEEVDEITHYLLNFEHEAKFLSKVPPIQGIIRARMGNGYDVKGHSTYDEWKDRLTSIFENLMNAKRIYMQLRYIDEKGNELVRVDYNNNKPFVIPDTKLQNKVHRYYFEEAIKLPMGKVYVSPIDLNKEHGQIEIPYKPTIRYATPILGPEGEQRGIVVMNVLAQNVLHSFFDTHEEKGWADFIIDKDGYYLHHGRNEKKEWGGPTDLNTGLSFKSDAPSCFEKVLSEDSGRFFCAEDKEYTFFERIQPFADSDLFWISIIRIPRNQLMSSVYLAILTALATLVFIVTLLLFISRYIAKQLKQYEKMKEDAERQKFNSVMQKMGDGVIVCSEDWKISAINPSAEQHLNVRSSDDINLLDCILNNFTLSTSKRELTDLSKNHKVFTMVREETEQFKPLYLEASMDIIKEPDENTSIILTLRDATELRRESLMKQDFLGLISHKLRTPVTVISNYTDMLKDEVMGELNDKQKKAIESILEKSKNLSGLIETLITFTTMTSDVLDLSKESIELKSYLPTLIDPLVSSFKDKKVDLNIDCPDTEVKLNINKGHFDYIIKQLVENAIKFNDKDQIKINVAVEKTENEIKIIAADNGRGIPSEEMEKVFHKFYQIDKYFTGNVEGAGLGLPLVKRLVEAFGGDISIKSEIGKGSKFIIILPV